MSAMFSPQTELLNSLARDLDHMLNDLCHDPGSGQVQKPNNNVRQRLTSTGETTMSTSPDVMSAQKKLLQLNNNKNQEDSAVSSSCSELEYVPPCQMSLTERLIRSHPIWFLPGIHRAGAEHLLQGKPPGTFIVRESSKSSTMALSVRLPSGKGPHVEHFLIEVIAGKLSLESSDNRFENISGLIAHYCTRCEELPVQLSLPESLQKVESRHQLSSLALLGQEFWLSRLAASPPGGSSVAAGAGSAQSSPASSLNKPAVNGSQSSLGSTSSPQQTGQTGTCTSQSSLSSSGSQPAADSPFTTFGKRLPSRGGPAEERASPVVLNLVPISEESAAPRPAARGRPTPPSSLQLNTAGQQSASLLSPSLVSRVSSPTNSRTSNPPKPPPRWCKPSLTPVTSGQVGMSVGGAALRRQARSASNTPVTELASPVTTPASCDDEILPSNQPRPGRRRPRKKRSNHYQEADILESPGAYYRSSVADKISDYEDIWASPPRELESESTFKPRTPARSMNDISDVARASQETADAVMELISEDRERRGLQLDLERSQRLGQAGLVTPSPCREVAAHSPFYALPADALHQHHHQQQQQQEQEQQGQPPDVLAGVQRRQPFDRSAVHRHSEPNIRWEPPGRLRRPTLETIDSSDEVHNLSNSVDNLTLHQQQRRRLRAGGRSQSTQLIHEVQRRGKPVQPPRVQSPRRARRRHEPWRLDSSWEFVGNDNAGFEADTEADEGEVGEDSSEVQLRRPPEEAVNLELRRSKSTEPPPEGPGTEPEMSREEQCRIVQAIIRQSLPQAVTSLDPPDPSVSLTSDYDNLRPSGEPSSPPGPPLGEQSEATDVSKWESIMRLMSDQMRLRTGQFDTAEVADDRLFTDSESFVHVLHHETVVTDDETAPSEVTATRLNTHRLPLPRSQQESLYSPPRLNSLRLHRKSQQSGSAIKDYVQKLAADDSNTFALSIYNFIQCTREGSEVDPHIVMRNMRQFINGMKNYLVKHGEGDFHSVVDQERRKLSSTEFLNLDAILEGVLEDLLIRPLHDHVSRLFADWTRRSGDLQRLADNLEFAAGRSPVALGLKPGQTPPAAGVLETARQQVSQLQAAVSPLDKLESLLNVISALFSAAGARDASLPADDFLPLLLYTLVHCHVTNIEFEADYMWGLLHPLLLNGEAGYYLTMLSSAVHVLKHLPHYLEDRSRESTRSSSQRSGSCSGGEAVEGFLRIIIPDEQQGTILSRTLPSRPSMTAREICKMLAHKLRITSPQDFGLFKLINGDETLLGDLDCPQQIKADLAAKGTHCMLAYKRLEAKIAWPTGQL